MQQEAIEVGTYALASRYFFLFSRSLCAIGVLTKNASYRGYGEIQY
jgi:hypothetical protein